VQKIGRVVRVDASTGEVLVLGAGRANDVPNGTLSNDISGNAATATALETARTIGGVSFDGTANINLPGVNTAGNQDTSGNAATATKWSAATTLSLAGDASGSVVFDGSDTTETLTVTVANDSHTHDTRYYTESESDAKYLLNTTDTLSGNLTVTGIIDVDEVRGDNGSATDPSFTFTDDQNTGMYRYGADSIGFATGGGFRARIQSDGIHLASGDWFRSYGSAGWYNATYAGGWYMTDSTWVRTYNNKSMLCNGIAATLTGTSTTSGYQYVMRNTTYGVLAYYTSTREVKENIVDVTSADSGAWMDALQPVMFNEKWLKEEEEPAEHQAWREADVQVGFIAEDVLGDSVVSQFAQVNEEDGVLKPVGWKWECVIAAAVAEIKALRGRVAQLESGS